jgi:hypothetical protein
MIHTHQVRQEIMARLKKLDRRLVELRRQYDSAMTTYGIAQQFRISHEYVEVEEERDVVRDELQATYKDV